MTEASDSQCCDRRKRNIYRVTSSINTCINTKIKEQQIIFRPTYYAKFLCHQRRILLVLPHRIFRHFSYQEKSFSGYSKKYIQFQEKSDEESTRANLQPTRAACSSRLQIAQSKLPIKIPTLRRKFAKFHGKEHTV